MVSSDTILLLLLCLALPVKGAQIPFLLEQEYSASSDAGATVSAVYPPPDATNAASSFDSYFPDATKVGYPGSTPTGDEAALIATASAVPRLVDTYPLLVPSALTDNGSSIRTSGNDDFDMMRHWGLFSPRFSVNSSDFGLPDASATIPKGCELQQVHLVHRHGARYPTVWDGPPDFASKVHNAVVEGTGFTAKDDLEFLNTWTYKLGQELLTPFGRKQLFDLGVVFRIEYGDLLKEFKGLPVFRTTSRERMVQSAQSFAAGFFGVPEFETDYRQLIIIEENGFNNTLASYNVCPNSATQEIGYIGDRISQSWAEIYLEETLQRFQSQVDGLNLTISDVLAMQEACIFETVALGSSVFCNLFTQEEWRGLDYYYDLLYWYDFGPGNPTAAAEGIGYVAELLSRLTQTPTPVHNSSTNATLNDNDVTFPLDQPIFVDATHDNIITSLIVALNFSNFIEGGPLPYDHIPDNKTYYTSHTVPFAATLIGQVLSCPSRSSSSSRTAAFTDSDLYFRWILNDGVVPQTGLAGCGDDPDGLCPLDTYISALQTRVGEVDFNFDCYGNYTVPDPDVITDGRPPVDQRPSSDAL